MKFGIRKWLEPGEEVLFDSRGHGGVRIRVIALILVTLGIAVGAGFMVSAFLRQRGPDAVSFALEIGEISFPGEPLIVYGVTSLAFVLVLLVWKYRLEPSSIQLTDRRLIRLTGKYRWPLEVLAYADIAEVRTRGSWITLVANGPDAVRRLNRNGDSIPTGKNRFGFQASHWKFFGSGEPRNEKALRIIGMEPLRWRKPELPPDVRRMIGLEWVSPTILAAIFLVLFTLVLFFGLSDLGRWMAFLGIFLLFVLPMSRYGSLWLAVRRLPPDRAVLYLLATAHPDWTGVEWNPRFDGYLLPFERQKRFLSRLLGRPIRIDDAPGPEAYGGGWVK